MDHVVPQILLQIYKGYCRYTRGRYIRGSLAGGETDFHLIADSVYNAIRNNFSLTPFLIPQINGVLFVCLFRGFLFCFVF